jgi:hypothetical protein
MAAPEVAGALVLLAAARPDLDGNGLRGALLAGVRHTGLPVSAGSLDIGAALHAVITPGAWKSAPDERLSSYTAATVRSTAKAKAVKKKATSKAKSKAKGKTSSKATKKAKARARAKTKARKARKAAARAKANRRGPRRRR